MGPRRRESRVVAEGVLAARAYSARAQKLKDCAGYLKDCASVVEGLCRLIEGFVNQAN